MEKQIIHLWGFEAGEISSLPADFVPSSQVNWEGGPIVVHARALDSFAEQADSHVDTKGRLPLAILYLPFDQQLPTQADEYTDFTVHEGDWGLLRSLLSCPQQLTAAEYADDLPVGFLANITRPVTQYSVSELPLPYQTRQHLLECSLCRAAYDNAVEERVRLRRMLMCPSVEVLAAQIRHRNDHVVKQHIDNCQFCQGEIAALGRVLKPVWLNVEIRLPSTSLLRHLNIAVYSMKQAINVIIDSLTRSEFVPSGQHIRRIYSDSGQTDDQTLIALLHAGEIVKLVRAHLDLAIRLDLENQILILGDLHGEHGEEIENFSVELWSSHRIVWSGTSTHKWIHIPIDRLKESFEHGADRFIIM